MKTIFLTSFHVLISRNILGTEVFRQLTRDPELRIVLFVPERKTPYFRKAFSGPGVIVEGVSTELRAVDRFLRQLSLACLHSRTARIKRRAECAATRRLLRFTLKSALARLFTGRAWARGLLRMGDRLFAPRTRFARYFERYQPALVFATDIQNEQDLALARGARRHDVPVVGMVRSWDNLTAKGVLRLAPDILVVNNELVRHEAMVLSGIPAEKIRVVGIPHYDSYRGSASVSREEFFRSLGLDPAKRLALIAPIGDRYICEFQKNCRNETDQHILGVLLRAQSRGELPQDLQFLVRLPPADVVHLEGFRPPPNLVIEQPGRGDSAAHIKEQELSLGDDRHLIDSLTHIDLLITGPSTMAVDGALFDQPIIIPNFEPRPRPYFLGLSRFYEYDHFRPIIDSGGARVAKSPQELIEAVNVYLADPRRDEDGRKWIVREQVWKTDGKSSERLLAVLHEYL